MRKVAITFIVAGCFILGFGIGIAVMLSINTLTAEVPNPQIEYIEVIDEVRVPYPVIVLDPQYIEVPVYYETIKEVPREFRHFETRASLMRWLDSKPILLVSGGDCDDFAMLLVEEANKDGYYIFFYPCPDAWHFKNCAIAGNNVYLIEPQNHEIELVMRVD